MSGTDFGHIGRRKPFSIPDTFSVERLDGATEPGETSSIGRSAFPPPGLGLEIGDVRYFLPWNE